MYGVLLPMEEIIKRNNVVEDRREHVKSAVAKPAKVKSDKVSEAKHIDLDNDGVTDITVVPASVPAEVTTHETEE